MDLNWGFAVKVDWTFGAERYRVVQNADAIVLADREDVEKPDKEKDKNTS